MAFKAKFKLDDCNVMNVLHYSFHLSQMTDSTGKATSLPMGGTINIVVESDETSLLFEYMKDPTLTKNGSLIFFKNNSISPLRTLKFTDAICIGCRETFSHIGNQPMQIELTLSARQINMNGCEFAKDWPLCNALSSKS